MAIGGAGIIVAGAAAAATLTTVFAPTDVASLPIATGALQSFVSALGLNGPARLAGVASPNGMEQLPFGAVTWSAGGAPRAYPTLGQAEAAAGLAVALPTTLPSGVSGTTSFAVIPLPRRRCRSPPLRATVSREVRSPSRSVQLSSSPTAPRSGRACQRSDWSRWRDRSRPRRARPVATSTGATTSQLESFLLSRPGVPPDLAEEIRLLGNLQITLSVPTPSGATESSVVVNGQPAVLLGEGGGLASGVIWEDAQGIVHTVAGPLDQEDVLDVARQIG